MSTTDSGIRPVGRFAPSPTGRMHAGNIYAALITWLFVKSQGGTVVLRIEDIDTQRSKKHFIDGVQRDFELLGLTWDVGPHFQSLRSDAYAQAFEVLKQHNLVYPCFCSRADLHASSAPHEGERFIYAGTCKHLTPAEIEQKTAELAMRKPPALPAQRLKVPADWVRVEDMVYGAYEQNLQRDCGDFIVRRSDGAYAYQLAVVVDDAWAGINTVIRGVDLLSSVPQQIYLQQCLGLPPVQYAHIPLFVDSEGRRLSKRNVDASLDELLVRYKSPEGILGHIAYLAGIIDADEPCSADTLLSHWDKDTWMAQQSKKQSIVFQA